MEALQIIWASTLMVFSVFTPGLAMTLALFPKVNRIKWVERIGLAFVFGMIPQLTLYFLAKNLSVPITTVTSTLFILVFTMAGFIVWKKRS